MQLCGIFHFQVGNRLWRLSVGGTAERQKGLLEKRVDSATEP